MIAVDASQPAVPVIAWQLRPFPEELRALPQWVSYDLVPDPEKPDEKPNKVPVNPCRMGRDGLPAKAASNRPWTWSTLANATDCMMLHDLAGRGFMFRDGGNIVGVDFDHCLNPDTGEVDLDVWRDVSKLRSYTEVSASGDGLHVLCHGRKPSNEYSKRGDFEMYDRLRWFAMTGLHVVGTPTVLYSNAREIDRVYVKYLMPPPPKNPPAARPDGEPDDWSRGPLILEGGRNHQVFRIGSAMRAHGLELEEIESQLTMVNETRCRPPLSSVEIHRIAVSSCRYPPGERRG